MTPTHGKLFLGSREMKKHFFIIPNMKLALHKENDRENNYCLLRVRLRKSF